MWTKVIVLLYISLVTAGVRLTATYRLQGSPRNPDVAALPRWAALQKTLKELSSFNSKHQSRLRERLPYRDTSALPLSFKRTKNENGVMPVKIQGNKDHTVPGTDPDYPYDVRLDPDDTLHLYWKFDDVIEQVTFNLRLRANKQVTVGFGFSDHGENTDADIILLDTRASKKRTLLDAHTDKNGTLRLDKSSSYELLSVRWSSDEVWYTFVRKFDTCDNQDYLIDAGTSHILSFTSSKLSSDMIGENLQTLSPNLQRVQLLKSLIPDPPLPSDTTTFTMHVDEVKVPNQETTYWCKVKKLPLMAGKHHIIRFEGAVSEAGEGIVHHMEVFHCQLPPGEKARDYDAPCRVYGAERPEGLESCRNVIGAWAMGARPLSYPEEAGFPIGGEDFSPYVMLEVHYNNPELKAGVVDSSGIKFHVTRQLRRHDAGVMELGMEYSDKYALPPGQPEWLLNGYCIPKCTQVGIPTNGIHVFASQLHTHLTGLKVYTKHYRFGIELPELNRDDHFSPHYQEIRKLPRPVTVMPGDSLVTTCVDQTMDRASVTLGGFSISDEMCVNYVHYYPKTNLEVCKSSASTESLYEFFTFLKRYQNESTSRSKGIADNWKSIRWTPMNVDLTREYLDTNPLSMQCNQSDGNRFPGVWEGVPIPDVQYPMPPSERPCLV